MRIINKVVVMCLSLGLSVALLASQSSDIVYGENVSVNESFDGFSAWNEGESKADFDANTWNTYADTIVGDHKQGDTKPWIWGKEAGYVSLNNMEVIRIGGTSYNDYETTDSWDHIEYGFDTNDYAILMGGGSELTLSFTVPTTGNYNISFSYGMRGWATYRKDLMTGEVDHSIPNHWDDPLLEVGLSAYNTQEEILLSRTASDVFLPDEYLDLTWNRDVNEERYGSIGEDTMLTRFSENYDLVADTEYVIVFYRSNFDVSSEGNSIQDGTACISNVWIGDSSLDAAKTPAFANNTELKQVYMIFYGVDRLIDIVNRWTINDINSDGSLTTISDDENYQHFLDEVDNLEDLIDSNTVLAIKDRITLEGDLETIDTHGNNRSVFDENEDLLNKDCQKFFNDLWGMLQDEYIADFYSPYAYDNIGCTNCMPD